MLRMNSYMFIFFYVFSGPMHIVRTCSTKMPLKLQVSLVCMKESRPGDGELCFCRRDLCNHGNSIVTSQSHSNLLFAFIVSLISLCFVHIIKDPAAFISPCFLCEDDNYSKTRLCYENKMNKCCDCVRIETGSSCQRHYCKKCSCSKSDHMLKEIETNIETDSLLKSAEERFYGDKTFHCDSTTCETIDISDTYLKRLHCKIRRSIGRNECSIRKDDHSMHEDEYSVQMYECSIDSNCILPIAKSQNISRSDLIVDQLQPFYQ